LSRWHANKIQGSLVVVSLALRSFGNVKPALDQPRFHLCGLADPNGEAGIGEKNLGLTKRMGRGPNALTPVFAVTNILRRLKASNQWAPAALRVLA
jgi:hypothetical protein